MHPLNSLYKCEMSLKVPPNNPTNDAPSETSQSLASCAPGLRLALLSDGGLKQNIPSQ